MKGRILKFLTALFLLSGTVGKTNGLDFSQAGNTPNILLRQGAHGNNQWIAVGNAREIYLSRDAYQWESVTVDQSLPSNAIFHDVHYADGQWVLVGFDGSPHNGGGLIYRSSDGYTWNAADLTQVTSSNHTDIIMSVHYAQGQWIAVGHIGLIWGSSDGHTWTELENRTTSVWWQAIHFGDGNWVTVGTEGHMAISENGDDWLSVTSPVNGDLFNVDFDDEQLWVATGRAGTNENASASLILASSDGLNWQSVGNFTNTLTLYGVQHAAGLWLAGGKHGALFSSCDGFDWEPVITDNQRTIFGIETHASRFLLVGENGYIAKSSDPSLVAKYSFNGHIDDISSYQHDGTFGGDATLGVDRFGNPSSAAEFSGNGWIFCDTDSHLNIQGSMTLATWVYLKPGAVHDQALISKYGPAPTAPDNQYLLGIQQGRILDFSPYGQSPAINARADVQNQLFGAWNHVVGTYDATTDVASIYFNGTLMDQVTANASPFGTNIQLSLGASQADGPKRYLNGLLDDACIFDRSLSSNEVFELFKSEECLVPSTGPWGDEAWKPGTVDGTHMGIHDGVAYATDNRLTNVYAAQMSNDGSFGPWILQNEHGQQLNRLHWSCEFEVGEKALYAIGAVTPGNVAAATREVSLAILDKNNPVGPDTVSTWETAPSLNDPRADAAVIIVGDYIYTLGGFRSNWDFLNTVEYARLEPDGRISNSGWQYTSSTIHRRPDADVVYYNGYLYVIAGGRHNYATNTIERAEILADGSLGAWQMIGQIPQIRGSHAATIMNDWLIVYGGWDAHFGQSGAESVLATCLGDDGIPGNWIPLTSLDYSSGNWLTRGASHCNNIYWISIGGRVPIRKLELEGIGYCDCVEEDNEAPTIICPPDLIVSTDTGSCDAVVTFETPDAFDDSGTVEVVCSPPSGSIFPVGSTTVVCSATDASGNTSSCSFIVSVEDQELPVITCPPAVMVQCDGSGNLADLHDWIALGAAFDPCGVQLSYDLSAMSDDCGQTGQIIATFTATDSNGNQSSCQSTFTVVDTLPPVISVPASDTIVECDGLGNLIELDQWLNNVGGALASDTCGSVTWTHNFETMIPSCGATGMALVTFTATDECGNASSTTATFQIVDTTPPDAPTSDAHDIYPSDAPIVFSAYSADVCGEALVEISAVTCHKVNPKGKIIDQSDNCDIEKDGSSFTIQQSGGVGTVITVHAVATDDCGNTSDASFIINVLRPANEGVGNGVDENTPGHDHNGGNDDPGSGPGNPGAKNKNN